jgi:hypothetical protein
VGLVVPSRIEGGPSDQLSVFAQHPDVEVGHEHEHPGADEPTPQPDVVKPRVVAKRDRAGDVDLVPSDSRGGASPMSRSRGPLVGAAFLLAAAIPVLLIGQQRDPQTGDGPRIPGRGRYTAPHEVPCPGAQDVSLAAASSLASFPIHRSAHPLASDANLTNVWVQLPAADSDDPATQVAMWYSSGLEIHMTQVSPGDKETLVSDFPNDLPVSYEKIGDTEPA